MEPSEEKKSLQLLISLDTLTNEINVSGPIQDDILCYGLLEKARQVISAYQVSLHKPKPNGGILSAVRNGFRNHG